MCSQTQQSLSLSHSAQLKESGITEEIIVRRGYSTVTQKAELNRLGFSRNQQIVPALLMPIWNHQGQIALHQLRPDQPRSSRGKTVRYETPYGSRVVIDVPPSVRNQVISEANLPLFITEGIKKADAAASRGLACVGLLGVHGWKGQDDFWRTVPLHGRIVYLVFDSDITTNSHVQKAAASLFAFLESKGARPMMIRLPTPGDTKVGLDDFLAAGNSVDDLMSLATDEAPAFQEPPKIRSAGTYEATDEGIVRITQTKDGPVQYRITNFSARIVSETVFMHGAEVTRELEIEATVGGQTVLIPLPADEFDRMGWVIPQLGAEAVIYPGQGVKDEVRAAIQLLSTNIRRLVGLDRLGWHSVHGQAVFVHAVGVICQPLAPQTDLIEVNRTAPNSLSASTLESADPQGPISPDVVDTLGIRMRIPQSLARYALPAASRGKQLRDDIRCSLKLLFLAKPTIAVPLYCATCFVAMAEADFSLHVYGGTGNFKTEFTALMVQHFGPELDARHLPANWSSTPNFLRSILAHAGNVIVPVDDFVPTGSQYDIDRSFRAAEDVFRSQGNAAGRGRCYRDGTPQQPEPPRGLVVSTGEVRPSGHSLTARVLMLEVQPGDIVDRTDPERLKTFTEHQQNAREGRFARATAAFLTWIATHYDEQQKLLHNRSQELRQAFATECQHARTADIAGKLLAGLERWLTFAFEVGAINDDAFESIWQHAQDALLEVLAAQDHDQSEENPVQRYLEGLRSSFAIGRAHLKYLVPYDDEDHLHGSPTYFGYEERAVPVETTDSPGPVAVESPAGDPESEESDDSPAPKTKTIFVPCGERIGWKKYDTLYLEPKASLAVVQRLLKEMHQPPIPLNAKALGKRLAERGLIESNRNDRNTTRANIEGCKVDVFQMRLEDLLELHHSETDFVDDAAAELFQEEQAARQRQEHAARLRRQKIDKVRDWHLHKLLEWFESEVVGSGSLKDQATPTAKYSGESPPSE